MKVKRLAVIYLYKNIFTEANRYQVLTLNYYVHYEKFYVWFVQSAERWGWVIVTRKTTINCKNSHFSILPHAYPNWRKPPPVDHNEDWYDLMYMCHATNQLTGWLYVCWFCLRGIGKLAQEVQNWNIRPKWGRFAYRRILPVKRSLNFFKKKKSMGEKLYTSGTN